MAVHSLIAEKTGVPHHSLKDAIRSVSGRLGPGTKKTLDSLNKANGVFKHTVRAVDKRLLTKLGQELDDTAVESVETQTGTGKQHRGSETDQEQRDSDDFVEEEQPVSSDPVNIGYSNSGHSVIEPGRSIEAATPMLTGTVKKFFAKKGFGFITPDGGGEDIFIHQNNYRSDRDEGANLVEGDKVTYGAQFDDQRKRYSAVQCSRMSLSTAKNDLRTGASSSQPAPVDAQMLDSILERMSAAEIAADCARAGLLTSGSRKELVAAIVKRFHEIMAAV
mmetsp:Transcript_42047/g.130248  ORF Transcript_42047/g.130248 Transcript_42047/m.130248 type:complete len:277 (+) Transcript_42047:2-832(+)